MCFVFIPVLPSSQCRSGPILVLKMYKTLTDTKVLLVKRLVGRTYNQWPRLCLFRCKKSKGAKVAFLRGWEIDKTEKICRFAENIFKPNNNRNTKNDISFDMHHHRLNLSFRSSSATEYEAFPKSLVFMLISLICTCIFDWSAVLDIFNFILMLSSMFISCWFWVRMRGSWTWKNTNLSCRNRQNGKEEGIHNAQDLAV